MIPFRVNGETSFPEVKDSVLPLNEAIRRICKERTTIIIAHRSSTIAMADRVVEMKGN